MMEEIYKKVFSVYNGDSKITNNMKSILVDVFYANGCDKTEHGIEYLGKAMRARSFKGFEAAVRNIQYEYNAMKKQTA